jgi:hypothetical protein
MKTKKEAIATFLGMDTTELKDYTYQEGRTNSPVYSVSNKYYCATKNSKPSKHRDIIFDWVEIPNDFINRQGFKIWKSE